MGTTVRTDNWDVFDTIKKLGYSLKYDKRSTYEMQLESVKVNGYAIRYIKNQTPELCLEAVRENGYAIKFIKNQTEELCLEAVRQNGGALECIEKPTPEMVAISFITFNVNIRTEDLQTFINAYDLRNLDPKEIEREIMFLTV